MPIYEYACEKCHQEFELLIRAREQPECPSCGSRQLQKQLSVPAAHTQSGRDLPICAPTGGACGRPQCGMGGCAFDS